MPISLNKFMGPARVIVLASTQKAWLQPAFGRTYRVELNAPGSFAFLKLPHVSQTGVAPRSGIVRGGAVFQIMTPCNVGDLIVVDAQENFVGAIAPDRLVTITLVDDTTVRGTWKMQNLVISNPACGTSSSPPPSSSAVSSTGSATFSGLSSSATPPSSSSIPPSSSVPPSSSAPTPTPTSSPPSSYSPPSWEVPHTCNITNYGSQGSDGTIVFSQFTRTGATSTCDTQMLTNGLSPPNTGI